MTSARVREIVEASHVEGILMAIYRLICWFPFLVTATTAVPETVVDRVVLRSGEEILGQIVVESPRGRLWVIARREWVATHLPGQREPWQAREAQRILVANRQRQDRLETWRQERRRSPMPNDPILGWIEEQLQRPQQGPAELTPLFLIDLEARTVRSQTRQPETRRRMLRQAWLAGLDNPESQSPESLRPLLEGRGFAPVEQDDARIDALVGPLPESDEQWRDRRAATEIAEEAGLRYIRFAGLVLPEDQGQLKPQDAGRLATQLLGDLLGNPDGPAGNPLRQAQQDAERRGRTAILVTELDTAPDLATVAVQATLWVKHGPDRWVPALQRSARVATDQAHPEEVGRIAEDPRIAGMFRVVESLGLNVQDARGQSLQVGAAVRQALGMTRAAIDREIDAWRLQLHP